MSRRILNILIALDQLIGCLITLGDSAPDETMSSVAYRMEQDGHFWGIMRPVIDWIFSPWGAGHCREAFESEVHGLQQSPGLTDQG